MLIAHDVLKVLATAQVDGNALVLPDQLDRKLYQHVNKILEAAGGKWNKKAQAHLFGGSAEGRVEDMLQTGSIEIPKDELNFFPSPPAVVARLLEIAQIQPWMKVLEPSAGQGSIAREIAYFTPPDCYELQEANAALLMERWDLAFVMRTDFLTVKPEPIYDRVIMNPPFRQQADIQHVMHAFQFLKPDGLLVSVMGASITFRENVRTLNFRNILRHQGGTIEPLPEGSFKASGTMVNSVIVTLPGSRP